MLKNGIKKRIFLILSSCFIILIIYLFPTTQNNHIAEEKKNTVKDTILYLIDENDYVARVSVYIDEDNIINKIKEIINYITIDSNNSNYIKEGFKPIIPKNTTLLSISIDGKLVKLNFSKEFLNVSVEDEEKLVSSIIYSITSLDGIEEVSIYVEGNILSKLPYSNKYLPPTLNRTFGINQIYDFTNIKGTTSTTIYYLSKYKDYYYYVPVTLINNNKDDEKIKIIIEEMASKSVYQTSLISYLKTAREINYNIDNDRIILNFTHGLFNELNNNNLLETIIYSLNLSIKENYNLKEVVYEINDYKYRYYSI